MAEKTFGLSGQVTARFTGGPADAVQAKTPFPTDPAAALREAVAMARSGKLGEAEARCRYVLVKRPDDANAHHLLGTLALNSGNAAEAVAPLERAVEINPRVPEFQTNLGVAYMTAGRNSDGIASFRKALEIHSGHGDGHLNLGLALLRTEGPAAALENLQIAARLLPKHAGAQMNLGLALGSLEGMDKGLRFLEKAAGLSPRDPLVLANLGSAYLNLDRPDDALEQYDRALAGAPRIADLHFGRAKVLSRLGRDRQAILSYRQAIKLNEGFGAAHSNLAHLLLDRGDLDLAEKHIRKALALRPKDVELHMNLVAVLTANDKTHMAVTVCQGIEQQYPELIEAYQKHASALQGAGDFAEAREVIDILRHVDPDPVRILPLLAVDRTLEVDDDTIRQVAASLDAGTVKPDEAVPVCFALGRTLERKKRFDEAFAYYRRGNEERADGEAFDPAAVRRATDRLIATFDTSFFDDRRDQGLADDRPIFIVGMPRSGTTLVEQILASHRVAEGAGELTEFSFLARELQEMLGCPEEYPDCVRHLDPPKLQDLGRSYLARQARRFPDAHRFTDKMPENFLHLGLIALTLPSARIIHCRRDPMDTCWSIFAQNFRGHHGYAHDLGDIGQYYVQYLRLMEHWSHALPLPILPVDYEAVVADPEGKTREILDFCGMTWDDDCLRFFENRRTVHTASHWQVRQPIYSSSIGRWRRFEKHLGPLLETLSDHGIIVAGPDCCHES